MISIYVRLVFTRVRKFTSVISKNVFGTFTCKFYSILSSSRGVKFNVCDTLFASSKLWWALSSSQHEYIASSVYFRLTASEFKGGMQFVETAVLVFWFICYCVLCHFCRLPENLAFKSEINASPCAYCGQN